MAVNLNETPTPAPGPDLEKFHAETSVRSDIVRRKFRHELGIAFGAHPRQILDIYYPKKITGRPPVVVFLHGGGFRQGSPTTVSYMGEALLGAGAIFIAMGYRLLPEVLFPDMCEDVADGLQWVYENIASRGGDPDHIYLSGHSAGATAAALVSYRGGWAKRRGLPTDIIKGLVLISGMYDHTGRSPRSTNKDSEYYVPSLASAIERHPEHTIITVAEDDLPACQPDGQALFKALKERGAQVDFVLVPGVDHYYAGYSLAEPDGETFLLTKRMLELTSK